MNCKWSSAVFCAICLAILSACGGDDGPAPPPAPTPPAPGNTVATAIATGTAHSCALLADKTVSCWGANGVGQLGNGTSDNSSDNSSTPQTVTGLSNVTTIAASATLILFSPSDRSPGGLHSCALLADETVWCWGDNSWHQLGPKAPPSRTCDGKPCSRNPVDVGLSKVAAVATGGAHSCVRLTDGTVWCWGANSFGQLGNGTFAISSPPVKVNKLKNVTAITAGGAHSCALLADGTVWCWGANSNGQLGPDVTSDGCRNFDIDVIEPCVVNPVPVHSLSNVAAIAAGTDYTCARLTDGTVQCWGANSWGQLGRDTSLGSTLTSIPAPVAGLSNVVTIATGGAHSCASLTDGTVKCWGANGGGQLGNTTPTPRFTPVPVSGLSNVAAVAAADFFEGSGHSCALLTDGTVWCWGANGSLQLGDGSITKSTSPITVHNLSNVINIASFGNYTCAILTDTTVKCWGANDQGQLGPNAPLDPSTGKPFRESLIPVAVGLNDVAAIAAGFDYTCALVTDSTVKCWGATSSIPMDVGLTDVAAIFVGGHDCAILKNGTVSCSDYWLLSSTRQPVELNGQATALAPGGDHTCARLTDGTVKCWGGFNDTGELGDGTFTNPATPFTPVGVVNLANVAGIAAGNHHNCATLFSSTAWCWGANPSGQLGNGTTDKSAIPKVVIGLSNVAAVAAGNQHSCARLTDGTVSCWGENRSGELGNGIIFSTLRPVKVVGIP